MNPPRARPRACRCAPPCAGRRDVGTHRGAVDAVVAAVSQDLGQRHCHNLLYSGLAPPPKLTINGVPAPIFGRHVAPGRSRHNMPSMIVRFCSGGLPQFRLFGWIGSRSFRMCHSASGGSLRLKPTSKRQACINRSKHRQYAWPKQALPVFAGAGT